MFFGTRVALIAQLGEALLHGVLDDVAEVDLRDPDVVVRVALDDRELLEIALRENLDEPLGEHRDAVLPAVREPLDDRPHERVDDRLQSRLLARELLGDERERRAGGLADAEREVPGLPPHGDDEVPARGRLRVDHQVVHDLDADGARRLVAEGADVVRQVEIVVDRLGNVHDPELAVRRGRELVGAVRGVVAADGDEHADAEPLERRQRDVEVLRVLGRVRARDAEVRAAAEVDAARVGDCQRRDVRSCPPP